MDKNTKLSKVRHVKAEIIVHCLELIDTKDEKQKQQAIEKLTDYAKFYRVSLRRKPGRFDLKTVLKKWILNKEGYNETIPNLYNALLTGNK